MNMDVIKPDAGISYRRRLLLGVAGMAVTAAAVSLLLWPLGGRPAIESEEVLTVMRGDVAPELVVLGTLQPFDLVSITSVGEAHVADVLAEPGQRVKRGMIMMRLESPQLSSQVEALRLRALQAESAVTIAEAQGDVARSQAASAARAAKAREEYAGAELRARTLASEAGVVSKMQLEEAKLAHRLAAVELDAANDALRVVSRVEDAKARSQKDELAIVRAQLTRAEEDVAGLSVRAPRDGTVVEILVENGQSVSSGTPLVRFAEGDGVYVKLKVPEEEVGAVRIGDVVSVEWASQLYSGSVFRIHPVARSGYTEVDAVLPQAPGGNALMDATVRARITGATREDRLFVSAAPGLRGNESLAVYVLNDRSATRTSVEFGERVGDYILVDQGLMEGEQFVVSLPGGESEKNFRVRAD